MRYKVYFNYKTSGKVIIEAADADEAVQIFEEAYYDDADKWEQLKLGFDYTDCPLEYVEAKEE